MIPRKEKWERTRHSLIQRLNNREDHRSWDEFVDLYWRRLYSLGMGYGLVDAEAQDAAQQTIIGVMKDIEKYDAKLGRFNTWLLGRAKWRIHDELRHRKQQHKRSRTRSRSGTATINRIPDAASLKREEAMEHEWREYLFKLAVDQIKEKVSPGHFEIFDLLVLQKLSFDEVAQLTGVCRATLDTIKHRVLVLVKEEIKVLEETAP